MTRFWKIIGNCPYSKIEEKCCLLLFTSLQAAAQQAVLEPIHLPASALAAPMVGTHLGALTSPTLRLSLTPSLQTPTLTSSLVPQVQVAPLFGAPVVAPEPVSAIILPGVSAQQSLSQRSARTSPTASVIATGMSVEQALSQRNAQPSQVLSNFYEGIPATPHREGHR